MIWVSKLGFRKLHIVRQENKVTDAKPKFGHRYIWILYVSNLNLKDVSASEYCIYSSVDGIFSLKQPKKQ